MRVRRRQEGGAAVNDSVSLGTIPVLEQLQPRLTADPVQPDQVTAMRAPSIRISLHALQQLLRHAACLGAHVDSRRRHRMPL